MILTIPTDARGYFRNLLRLLQLFKPFNEMPDSEIKLFSLILLYYHRKKMLSLEDASGYIFSKAGRFKLMNDLGVSRPRFDNMMLSLRKKGLITYDGIVPKYLFKYNEGASVNEVVFKFVKDEREKKQQARG